MARAKKKAYEQTFNRVYYTPRHASSYGGVQAVQREVGRKYKKFVPQWLSLQDTYTLHKPVRYHFPRRRVIVGGMDHQWQADLVDLRSLSKFNKGFTFLLTCIDVLSKYAWVVPLKDKTGRSLVTAFMEIFKHGRQPLALQSDKGSEFTNRVFQKFLHDRNIAFFTTENEDIKACIVERFNRTLKTKMWKYFTKHSTLTYHHILQDLVWSYNHSYHRSIKRSPASVTAKNQEDVWYTLYGSTTTEESPICKFQVGDHVRISKAKRTFKKGYLPNWTREIFLVAACRPGRPPVYELEDANGEKLRGTFYAEELQHVHITEDKLYKIQAILDQRRRGKVTEYLVKWEGYPDSFNSWIKKTELKKYKG